MELIQANPYWSPKKFLFHLVFLNVREHPSLSSLSVLVILMQFLGLFFIQTLTARLLTGNLTREGILLLPLLGMVLYCLFLLRSLLLSKLAYSGQSLLERSLFQRLKRAQAKHLDAINLREVNAVIARDFRSFSEFLFKTYHVLTGILVLTVFLAYVSWVNIFVGLVLIVLATFMFFMILVFNRYNQHAVATVFSYYHDAVKEFSEGLDVSPMLRVYNRVSWFSNRISKKLRLLRNKYLEWKIVYRSFVLSGLLDSLRFLLILGAITAFVWSGKGIVDPQIVFIVSFLLVYVVNMVFMVLQYPPLISFMEGIVSRHLQLFALPVEVREPRMHAVPRPVAFTVEDKAPLIAFKYLGYGHNSDLLFSNFTGMLMPGQIGLLIGESGAGKSTLFRVLCRFYEPSVGSVVLHGKHGYEWDLLEYRDEIAIAFQEPVILPGSLQENLVWDVTNSFNEKAFLSLLDSLNLQSVYASFSQGLQTIVFKDTLSTTQKSFIGIMRAFLSEKPILLLDEPFPNTQPEFRQMFLLRAKRILETDRKVALVISHDRSLLDFSDKAWVLEGSRVKPILQ